MKIQLIGIAVILYGIAWILLNIALPIGTGASGGIAISTIGLIITIFGAFIEYKKDQAK